MTAHATGDLWTDALDLPGEASESATPWRLPERTIEDLVAYLSLGAAALDHYGHYLIQVVMLSGPDGDLGRDDENLRHSLAEIDAVIDYMAAGMDG